MSDDLSDRARPTEDDGPITIHVGNETFTVEIVDSRHFHYGWDSGPNPGYGFSSGLRTVYGIGRDQSQAHRDPERYPTVADHRHAVEQFLSMVDPETGYIE
jgi:hypothetical protein